MTELLFPLELPWNFHANEGSIEIVMKLEAFYYFLMNFYETFLGIFMLFS